tara:strand:+ start:237 stop:434 length:198 start_codon:yes stop_codon:yes gene_type:complete
MFEGLSKQPFFEKSETNGNYSSGLEWGKNQQDQHQGCFMRHKTPIDITLGSWFICRHALCRRAEA